MISTLATGSTRFRVFLPHASRVELVGTFTNWREQAIEMTRQHPGWWELDVDIGEGEHQYCYLVDGHLWLADYAAHGVKLNGYGGWISRLVVQSELKTSTKSDANAAMAA